MDKCFLDEMSMLTIDISYQDTDIGGVVYFANYFNYGEKGRSKLFKACFGKTKISKDQNWVIKSVKCDYIAPVTIDELLKVKTSIIEIKKASIMFLHEFFVEDKMCAKMEAHLLSVNENLKPARINEEVYNKLLNIITTD